MSEPFPIPEGIDITQYFGNLLQTLQRTVAQLEERNEFLTGQVQAPRDALQSLQDSVARLETRNANLEAQLESSTSPRYPSSNLGAGRRKLPDPPMFKGNKEDVRIFLEKVDNVLRGEYASFPSEESKLSYLTTRLDGDAYLWYSHERSSHEAASALVGDEWPPLTYNEVAKKLLVAFSDSNEDTTAQRAIMSLRQGKGSCQKYAFKFSHLVYRTKWNEATRMDYFREGLSPELQDRMAVLEEPISLDAFIKQAIIIDDRLFKNKTNSPRVIRVTGTREATSSRNTQTVAVVNHPPGDSYRNTSHVPMDLSATKKRGPLSAEEKERRKRLNLCAYCGDKGHGVNDCPLCNRTTRPNVNAMTMSQQDDGAEERFEMLDEDFDLKN